MPNKKRGNKSKKNLISLVNISKSYDNFLVLKKVNFSLYSEQKVGLVGPNGVGKTTLLKILMGLIMPTKGQIERIKNLKIGYFTQDFLEQGKISALNFLQEFTNIDETVIKSNFHKFSLQTEILSNSLSNISEGERGKLGIIKIMSTPYDLLLLDEPTNNLDLSALKLFEDYIKKSKKAFLIISHDREFLNRTVSKIIEIDEFTKESIIYDGDFGNYYNTKREKIKKEWVTYNNQQEKIFKTKKSSEEKIKWMNKINQKLKDKKKLSHKITNDIDKTPASVLRDKAGVIGKKSRIIKDRLKKIKEKAIEKPKNKPPLKLSFKVHQKSGDNVFKIINLTKKLNNFSLGPLNLTVQYADRILIIGPNGAGKSTLINIITENLKPDEGSIKKGTKVKIGYLSQSNNLNPSLSILGYFLDSVGIDETTSRKLLNRFSFTGDDVHKKIKILSPGEKSRLTLAILMARQANCIILDEPSNHLDIEAMENLEEALQKYSGTLIVISHDRYFIDKINISKTYLLEKGKNLKNVINYHEYKNKNNTK